ncbi:phosphoenolpyruvate synthase [Polaromonas sp. JS666]|uniref:phosphoenolpyruvate synthase n=1 Tax=Polaromonas sp. (strain JS666 / ATCC BAA-500) TaxID=296591 RepID=UPI0000463E3A|nr:phosphoenolpyruvate synthase [Polaromonas sp. JS666]ABE44673.1 phosphoenolpyruvate synthase [Polaromonas sp. JS666]
MTKNYIRWFSEIGVADVALVGGKNASLGEMVRELGTQNVRVPNGFAVTAEAYRYVLDQSGAWPGLHDALDGLDVKDVDDLARRAQRAREIIQAAPLPEDLVAGIAAAYTRLQTEYGEGLTVAVRSSATAEDLPTASFAGQHETFLNISGQARLLDAVRQCFASLFKDRAIAYRVDHGIDHFRVFQSVGVMKMVRADRAASGVIFTLDTETGFRDVVFVTGAYGLGENVVQGTVDPDEFYVFKPTLRQGHRVVLRRKLGGKEIRMVYARAAGRETTRNMPTPPEDQARYCISDDEVLELADAAIRIEDHYSRKSGHPTPMDIEWAKDGLDGKLYIVQARPETVASRKPLGTIDEYRLGGKGALRVSGRAVGSKIASGRARVISDVGELNQFQPGEVLVADTTMPDWGTVMKIAAAVVTNRGGRTCHAAIVAREMGIPAVVGCGQATTAIRTGDEITVSCAEGSEGRVYAGLLPFTTTHLDVTGLPRPQTHMMVNIANPDTAFQTALLPNDGVGLARMEFIVAEHIRAHPMALVHPEKIEDASVREEIARLTRSYAKPADYFVRQLSEGVATIAAAFWPKPVIVRMSDFKTNEYASLLGGRWFEPVEANPMIGFRGASRYAHPAYAEGFALECAAMKRVRDEMGLSNVRLMIPFCRRVEEGERVLQAMAGYGLARGGHEAGKGLEIYVMCEIPNNVIQIDAFARLFDGFSIGSNDLTQLALGVDRDSDIVAFDFDERDPGVKMLIRQTIEGARRNHRHVGICGQAPSDYPEIAEYLVELGIDSMSVTPDTLMKITRDVLAVEARLGRAPRSAAPARHEPSSAARSMP